MPLLLGWNSDESARFMSGGTTRADYLAHLKVFGDAAPDLLRAYPAADDGQAAVNAVDLASDTTFGWRSWSLAEARLAKGAPATFVYQFDNPPPGPDGKRTKRAVHSDELRYVWGDKENEPGWSRADAALEDTVQTYWVNFARTGNPNGPGLVPWPAYRPARTALWFADGKARTGAVLRADKLRIIDQAVRQPAR